MEKSQLQRAFALQVLRRLRESGFQALWAGGCVRDHLLGRVPEDYDVATDAQPEQVRALFGRRRTLAVGQSFGVIIVLAARDGSQQNCDPVEVATFRKDSSYSDGRHPDSVEFSTPEADAARRDFTVNGLFYDPIADEVVDFVGGQADLRDGLIRAIGDPHQRFSEDKLRIIRAIRFATTLDFEIEPATWEAILQRPDEIISVSVERVTGELRKVLLGPHRTKGLRLLHDSGLLQQVLPEVEWSDPLLEQTMADLNALRHVDFATVFALLIRRSQPTTLRAAEVGRRWRLTNAEIDQAKWLLEQESLVLHADQVAWPELQPALVHAWGPQLVEYGAAICEAGGLNITPIAFCRERLSWPSDRLNPPALLDGNRLAQAGIRPGPIYKQILQQVRDAQLLGEVTSTAEALKLAAEVARDAG